eukprot:scaffold6554_cov142-Isochrysis_galbana.AAC.2
MEKKQSCTFRIQSDDAPLVNMSSRYTPANPESPAAPRAAQTPRSAEPPVGVVADLASWLWTSTTPALSITKLNHCSRLNFLDSRSTEKKAVDSVFDW